MDIEAARLALKGAVMASNRRMEWEQATSHRSKSWRIQMRDEPTWVYVWPANTRFAVKYYNEHGNEKVTHCGNPMDAVALAERYSLGEPS